MCRGVYDTYQFGRDILPLTFGHPWEETMTEGLYVALALIVFGAFSATLLWVDFTTKDSRPPMQGPGA